MQKRIKIRLLLVFCIIFSVAGGVYIILYNLNENITFFYPPSKITSNLENKLIRVGGLVVKGSIKNLEPGKIVFTIIDEQACTIDIYFHGIPPGLFRENQGVIAKGRLRNNLFYANELLVKHDENYYPPSINFD